MPLLMVTVAVAGDVPETALTVQTEVLELVIVGATLALVVAETPKVLPYAELAGAPVNATVGVASEAVVVWVAEATA